MKKRTYYVRLFAVAVAIHLSVQALAQTLSYSDADSPSEAIGMMKVNMHTAEVVKRECSARVPQMASQIEADLDKWKSEAHALERTDHYWAQMIEQEPKLQETLVRAANFVGGHIRLLEQSDPEHRTQAVSHFCIQHFSDLASGVWRQRKPRLYGFLDRAP